MSGDPTGVQCVEITIATAANSGSSAANPGLIGGVVMGWVPFSSGNSVYQIRRITVNADGSVTINLNANPTAASAIIRVMVGRFQ